MSIFVQAVPKDAYTSAADFNLAPFSDSNLSSTVKEVKIFQEKLLLLNYKNLVEEKPDLQKKVVLISSANVEKPQKYFSIHTFFDRQFSFHSKTSASDANSLTPTAISLPFSITDRLKETLLDSLDIQDLRFAYLALADCAERCHFTESSGVFRKQADHLKKLDAACGSDAKEIFWTLAQKYEKKRDFERAEFYYQKLFCFSDLGEEKWIRYAEFYRRFHHNEQAIQILEKGMTACPGSKKLLENLLFLLLHLDKLSAIRQIFSQLRGNAHFQDNWLEIQLLEAEIEGKAGNALAARNIFKRCLNQNPTHPEVIKKFSQFEAELGNTSISLNMILNFIKLRPDIADVWDLALELREKHAYEFLSTFPFPGYAFEEYRAIDALFKSAYLFYQGPRSSLLFAKRANTELRFLFFCKGFAWVTFFDRTIFLHALNAVSKNEKWKVLIERAKSELLIQENCRKARATCVLVSKLNFLNDPEIYLQVALMNECMGKFDSAFFGFSQAFNNSLKNIENRSKFASHLIKHQMRRNQIEQAKKKAMEVIDMIPDEGHLWQLLVQSSYQAGGDDQMEVLFRRAFKHVQGSAELNCEYARFHLNPLCRHFDPEKAHCYLQRAIKLDPKYGDSYIEFIRLKVITEGEKVDLTPIKKKCYAANPDRGELWKMSIAFPLMSALQIFDFATQLVKENFVLFNRHYKRSLGEIMSGESEKMQYLGSFSLAYLALTGAYALNNRSFHRIRELRTISLREQNQWILHANN